MDKHRLKHYNMPRCDRRANSGMPRTPCNQERPHCLGRQQECWLIPVTPVVVVALYTRKCKSSKSLAQTSTFLQPAADDLVRSGKNHTQES
ncbi:hypothetical protein GE21DRAFT_1078876 [Neurospora crassa]|nr:hypothetical protein GE21DRAFT_1078876 [Neurospora crassa]